MAKWWNSRTYGGKRVAALAVLAVTGAAASAPAQSVDAPAFGMVGLARGQDAILSLVLVGSTAPEHPGCRVMASFVDARGQVLRDVDGIPVQKALELRDGVAATLALRGVEVIGSRVRVPIRAVLALAPEDGSPSDCMCMYGTLELVSTTTGHTDVVLPAKASQRPPGGGNPPPAPACTF